MALSFYHFHDAVVLVILKSMHQHTPEVYKMNVSLNVDIVDKPGTHDCHDRGGGNETPTAGVVCDFF